VTMIYHRGIRVRWLKEVISYHHVLDSTLTQMSYLVRKLK
jgi:hypothetical protein